MSVHSVRQGSDFILLPLHWLSQCGAFLRRGLDILAENQSTWLSPPLCRTLHWLKYLYLFPVPFSVFCAPPHFNVRHCCAFSFLPFVQYCLWFLGSCIFIWLENGFCFFWKKKQCPWTFGSDCYCLYTFPKRRGTSGDRLVRKPWLSLIVWELQINVELTKIQNTVVVSRDWEGWGKGN